jgi:hypothetical protein
LAESSVALAVAATRVDSKCVSSESLLCHRLGFEDLHGAHGAQTQTPSRSRVCPGRERSISPARSTTPAGSKFGDGSLRRALYDAAQIILTKPLKGCSQPKSWAMRIARCAGMSKAKGARPSTFAEGALFDAGAV